MYQQIIQKDGMLHLKTDSPQLYHFTKKVIERYHCSLHEDIEDIYNRGNIKPELSIKTHYEALDIAQSKRVHYLRFSLPPQLPGIEEDKTFHDSLKMEND